MTKLNYEHSIAKSWYETGLDLLAAMIAAVAETTLFHPVDTARNRLQYHTGTIRQAGVPFFRSLSNIVFATKSQVALTEKIKNMYPGVSYAIGYKMVQRTVKLGLQPTVKSNIQNTMGEDFQRIFGINAHVAMHIAASVPLSWLELFVLSLDVLKVKYQTNMQTYKGKSFLDIVRTEDLSRRALWVSATRISLGTACYFGVPIVVKQRVFNLEADEKMTTFQNFATSAAGAACGIVVVNPLDVVKTRMMGKQILKNEAKLSGTKIAINIIKTEGAGVFGKGLVTAFACNWPRSTFAMFATNKLRGILSVTDSPKPKI